MMQRLLFEIGTEELPVAAIPSAAAELARKITTGLTAVGLTFEGAESVATPRRLALLVDVASSTPAKTEVVLGPPARVAFDAAGGPTKATLAFALRLGRDPASLERIVTEKGEYVGTRVATPQRPATEYLPPILRGALDLSFAKSMRWGNTDRTFARPVRWLCALLDGEVIDVKFADVQSGRATFGHRFLYPGRIELKDARDYVEALRSSAVIGKFEERREMLVGAIGRAAQTAGGQVRPDENLVTEVCGLVENPLALLGRIPGEFLTLPPEVLIQEMRIHQRYFAVEDTAGALLPYFVAVSNTPVRDASRSIAGYERVLRARLSDARFFFDEDRKVPLETLLPRLAKVVFHRRAGTVLQKVERVEQLGVALARATGHTAVAAPLARAARLCKADLLTNMVKEFPELQGVIGRYYALLDGETADIADAIQDHYRPRGSSDGPAKSLTGALLGTADRFDTLCALFAASEQPTSTADPFGLRRASLGIIAIAETHDLRFSLQQIVAEALTLLRSSVASVGTDTHAATSVAVLDFMRGRMRALWSETYRSDIVEAVLAAGFDDIVTTSKRLRVLAELLEEPQFKVVTGVVKRVVNIVNKESKSILEGEVDAAVFIDPAESALYERLGAARSALDAAVATDDYRSAFLAVAALEVPIAKFFDDVLVMADDRRVRSNRLRLLRSVAKLVDGLADFSRIT